MTQLADASGRVMRLWIPGKASPKKTSQRIVKGWSKKKGKGFSKILPNPGYEPWAYSIAAEAVRWLYGPPPWRDRPRGPGYDPRILDEPWATGPVHVRVVYTPENRAHLPDLSGILESVGDALQLARVISNDRNVKRWDGSRIQEPDPANFGTQIDVIELDPESMRVRKAT